MAVNKIGTSKETVEAACEFVRYMSSVDAERLFVAGCLDEGEAESIPPYLLKEFRNLQSRVDGLEKGKGSGPSAEDD